MKKIMIFVVIATVVFVSCESKSSEGVKDIFKTSFKEFKEIIQKSPLDSSFVNKSKNGTYYTFYMSEYQIDIEINGAIRFKTPAETQIYTRDIVGEFVSKFCTSSNNWTEKEKMEILDLLLAKKGKKSLPKKEEQNFFLH